MGVPRGTEVWAPAALDCADRTDNARPYAEIASAIGIRPAESDPLERGPCNRCEKDSTNTNRKRQLVDRDWLLRRMF